MAGSAARTGQCCRTQKLYLITFEHWASHQHSILLRWFLLGQSFWRANKKPMLKISEVPNVWLLGRFQNATISLAVSIYYKCLELNTNWLGFRSYGLKVLSGLFF